MQLSVSVTESKLDTSVSKGKLNLLQQHSVVTTDHVACTIYLASAFYMLMTGQMSAGANAATLSCMHSTSISESLTVTDESLQVREMSSRERFKPVHLHSH